MTAECILSLTSLKKIELSLRKNVCYRYIVCVCVCEERGKGGRGRVRRRRREEDTQRFSGWPMNEPLEVGGEETWPLGSCPTASLLGNRLLA